MSAFHKSEFWAAQCRLANPSSLNSIIYKIKTLKVSNGRFIVKYNVLFILDGQKLLSLPEFVWLSSVLPRVLVDASLFSRGVRQASRRALHLDHWYMEESSSFTSTGCMAPIQSCLRLRSIEKMLKTDAHLVQILNFFTQHPKPDVKPHRCVHS